MSEQPSELERLLAKVRAGDNDAVREVVVTYGPFILQQIRGALHQPLRTLYDSTDILQEVWEHFFLQRIHQRDFPTIEDLIHYFAGMSRSIIDELHRRHLSTRKRDIRRQVPLNNPAVAENQALIDPRPTPEGTASRRAQCVHALGGMAPELQRTLLMLAAGYSYAEVAQQLGVPESALRLILENTRRRARRKQRREAE